MSSKNVQLTHLYDNKLWFDSNRCIPASLLNCQFFMCFLQLCFSDCLSLLPSCKFLFLWIIQHLLKVQPDLKRKKKAWQIWKWGIRQAKEMEYMETRGEDDRSPLSTHSSSSSCTVLSSISLSPQPQETHINLDITDSWDLRLPLFRWETEEQTQTRQWQREKEGERDYCNMRSTLQVSDTTKLDYNQWNCPSVRWCRSWSLMISFWLLGLL